MIGMLGIAWWDEITQVPQRAHHITIVMHDTEHLHINLAVLWVSCDVVSATAHGTLIYLRCALIVLRGELQTHHTH